MLRNFFYLVGQGLKNLVKHKASSLFSLLVMIATISLFSGAYCLLTNVNRVVKKAQDSVGITVFFEDGMSEAEIMAIGERIGADESVSKMVFTSAAEAWENFKTVYFEGNEELAEGFVEDNPLANCASYEIFLEDISAYPEYVEYLQTIKGVRKVNYSALISQGLDNLGRIVRTVSLVVLVLLLVVSVTLVSNSVSQAIAMRQEEIHIMRYVGATNAFIRFPFKLQGALLGLVGAALPLLLVWRYYEPLCAKLTGQLASFSHLFNFLSLTQVMQLLIPVDLILGIGIGLLGCQLSIRKHLQV